MLNISTLEAASLEDIDADAVKVATGLEQSPPPHPLYLPLSPPQNPTHSTSQVGLAQYSEAYANATDDLLKSEAEIGVEVYQALSHSLAEA